ncbi:hypothetical protein NX059_009069 [Plenodomus lindquistii]|nr:hypothetical protein NX059_009069 [Plenodomus lindquistii]
MAVTKKTPELKVQIFVNGAPLEEHHDGDEMTADDAVTAYVEAVSGANFEIRYTFGLQFVAKHDVNCCIEIDGKSVGSPVFDTLHPIQKGHVYDRIGEKEEENGKCFVRRFRFVDVEIGGDEVPKLDKESTQRLKNVGTISLKYYWGVAGKDDEPINRRTPSQWERKVIPEKALKGSTLSHQASVGPREQTKPRLYCSFQRHSREPFATFTFRYRSRAALKSLLIIPRSPSPVPLEERDVETLTAEESRQLIRRLRQRDRSAVRVKKEGVKREASRERSSTVVGAEHVHVDDDDVSFVSEQRKRRLPVSVNEEGVETIDLT